jgi:hypothetical protein
MSSHTEKTHLLPQKVEEENLSDTTIEGDGLSF